MVKKHLFCLECTRVDEDENSPPPKRHDVEVVTVELDDEVQQTARSAPSPPWVRFESCDEAEAVGRLGQFDLTRGENL